MKSGRAEVRETSSTHPCKIRGAVDDSKQLGAVGSRTGECIRATECTVIASEGCAEMSRPPDSSSRGTAGVPQASATVRRTSLVSSNAVAICSI